MSALQPAAQTKVPASGHEIVNDFSITVATINGSGSQTSNLTILRALFKMGIPVSGKNLFPSNIQGQPTWYTIRVSKDGFLARRETQEVVVAMNPQTFNQDLKNVVPGGAFYYADDIKLPIERTDVSAYAMPVKRLVKESGAASNLRDYVANMVYVGVLAYSLGMDLDKIYQALNFHFKGKTKAIDLNFGVVKAAYDWAAESLEKKDPYRVAEMDATCDYIMADGNTAAALGAIYGGVQFVGWYPITPASTLAESLNQYLPMLRKDPVEEGKLTYAVVQAEDELAAVGMAIGAGWAGLRAMTSTSGPGISLMGEYAGLAYFAEIPVVIWNVQRVGPSTGLPTRTSQGDLTQTYFLSHGDTQMVILLPGSVTECFEFGWRAFDVSERLQTPVFVMIDLDMGMNQWMTRPFEYPDTPVDRGKVLWEEDLERLQGQWGRYQDVDEDGIPYRTVPGNRHPAAAYFTRGTGHDPFARYSEDPQVWTNLMNRLKQKFNTARQYVPAPVLERAADAQPGEVKVGIIAWGSTEPAVKEARQLLSEGGLPTDFLRIRAVPFNEDVTQFIQEHDRIYVFEMNRDGQMAQLLTLEYPQYATKLISVAYNDGLAPTACALQEAILAKEAK